MIATDTKYKFTLESNQQPATGNRSQRKHHCPRCGQRRFVRYIDVNTRAYLPEQYGRCDREQSCQYHLKPGKEQITDKTPVKPPKPPKPPTYTSPETVRRSLTYGSDNHLIRFLIETFGEVKAMQAVKRYRIGTDHSRWPGAAVFWQIDRAGNVRGGKVMGYNHETGKRLKSRQTWTYRLKGTRMHDPKYVLKQCLFGEHLLRQNPDIVCVVESEKTAVIASIQYPQYAWLATGGLSNKPFEKCKALIGKRVLLVPDIGCYDQWQVVAKELNQLPGANFKVFDFLESKAGQLDGYDIADFLVEARSPQKPNEFNALKSEKSDPSGLLHVSGLAFLCERPETEPERNIDHTAYFAEHEKYWHDQEQSAVLSSMKQKNPDVTTLIDQFNLKTLT